jgi:ribosomal protein S18 acetylase RimI-like enzyme
VGFVHAEIDKGERLGWGFIFEFCIMPTKRKMGLGRTLLSYIANILQSKGVKNIWLLTNPQAVPFWRSLGFKLTEEKDKETGQDIMVKSL